MTTGQQQNPGSTKRLAYLVTGGTGFIGSALVRRLVSEGHHANGTTKTPTEDRPQYKLAEDTI